MNFTDDQLFDFFLGELDPKSAREVATYLETHPEIKNKFEQFRQIESNYQKMPLEGPSEQALQAVLAGAKRELQPSFWSFLRTPALRQSLAYGLMTLAVASVGLFIHRFSTSHEGKQIAIKANPNPALTTLNSNNTVLPPDNLNQSKKPAANAADEIYQQALVEFEAKNFSKVNELFSDVIKKDPLFSNREELYSKWIVTLTQLNKLDEAEKVRLSLKQLMDSKNQR